MLRREETTTILSSKRVIKRSGALAAGVIEPYIPPVEITVSNREKETEKPVFPHCDREGLSLEDEQEPYTEELIPEEEPEDDELEEQRQELLRMLEDARQEAAQMLADARQEAQKILEDAREEGYREGYERGNEEGRSAAVALYRKDYDRQLLIFREDMQNALKAVETAKEKCLYTYLDELKDCAIAIGEKVIQISLKSSGEVIRQMIISATEKLKKTAWVKIYIDKCDYDMMMEADADIIDELSHLSDNIKFIVMDKEDTGSCIIEMPEEIVDVSVSTQIENIRDILENVRV